MAKIDIAIPGAGGRMGRMLVQTVAADAVCRLVAASETVGSEFLNQDAGEVAGVGPLGVVIQDHASALFEAGRVVIDFTVPQATVAHVQLAREAQTGMVIGTTGINAQGLAVITEASKEIPIVFAPNFSVGVNLMMKMVAQVAATLGDGFDIEIIEAHHRHKVDAPSGTALGLGRAMAAAKGEDLQTLAVYTREGHTGARKTGSIGFATVRGGDIVGDHTVLFAGDGERFEVTHKASSRMTFAKGAVKAACWLAGKPPKLYDMNDVLGFR